MNIKKTIFITGASSGLDKATARLFQLQGWNVIATMRKPNDEKELSGLENVRLLPLDVTNPEQIKTTVEKDITLYDIDVVFNNVGYGLLGAMEALSDEQILNDINTNLLGVLCVTHAFIPYFRKKNAVYLSVCEIPTQRTYFLTSLLCQIWSHGNCCDRFKKRIVDSRIFGRSAAYVAALFKRQAAFAYRTKCTTAYT